jgi:hypothetical protein
LIELIPYKKTTKERINNKVMSKATFEAAATLGVGGEVGAVGVLVGRL